MEGLLWAEDGFKNLGMGWLEDYVVGFSDPESYESDRGVEDYYLYIKGLSNGKHNDLQRSTK